MYAALRVHRFLPQKIPALYELTVELIVKIIAIRDNNNGRTIERRLQQMRIEHHRQRLPAALCMPEHAALPVGLCRLLRRPDRLVDGEILMIAREYLDPV